MKNFLIIFALVFCGLVAFPVHAVGGKVVVEALSKWGDDLLEVGAKVSGRTLSKAEKATLGKVLMKSAITYGDDAMERIIRKGGLEVLEQSAKHGDDFLRLCKAVPDASRALAMHTDDLLPIAKRIGPDFLRLECKAPGLAKRIVEEFGDDAARVVLAKSPGYSARLLSFAGKADSPATKTMLYECYKNSKNSKAFLDSLNWKHIMAGGLSVSMITAAYKVSDGIQEGISNPEVAKDVFNNGVNKLFYICLIIVGLFAIFVIFKGCPFASKQLKKSIAIWRQPETVAATDAHAASSDAHEQTPAAESSQDNANAG